jgi:F0F1-type ATP synthase assembly protein I
MEKPAKTPRWARCLAISVLVGLSVGILTIAITSFFFYRHYASQFPADTQNILSALTSGVLVGIGVGAVAAVATSGIYLLLGLRGTPS